MPPRDLFVMTGKILSNKVEPGMWIDLPKELKGPGKVQISSIEYVEFADKSQKLALCIPMNALSKSFHFDVSKIEGEILKVT